MKKSYRQGQIIKLIQQHRVTTQEQLAAELGELGIKATQVTLSRDIRELGLVKTPAGYRQTASGPEGPGFATVCSDLLRDVRVAQQLVVLKTSPGNANSLAIALDREEWPEIAGTLAGDDTILVVAPNPRTAKAIRAKLLRFF